MSEAAISIQDLRVDYGEFMAVDDFSLEVPRGVVFGLVGPNGAGKTSTFKVLATLMEPTYGEVSLMGIDVLEKTERARRILGYMPDLAPVPSDLKVWEFLDFHADTHGLGGKRERLARVEECLEKVKLMDKRGAWCHEMSRGQTQRLVLAKTLLHRPQVMILDEPASGLDPLSRREMRLTLQALAGEGVTVMVSSHILTELSEMCSQLCIMNQGKLLATGTAEEVRRELGSAERTLRVGVLKNESGLAEWLAGGEGVGEIEHRAGMVSFQFTGSDEEQAALLGEMVAGGWMVKSLEESGSTFEEILVDVAEKNRES